MDYDHFLNKVFKESFFKERIIYSFLPYGIKGFVSDIPKIVINICGNSLIYYKLNKNSNELKIILKALYACIILHELIHIIRKENPRKIINNENTPERNYYEGGRSFIYYIFKGFAIIYVDLSFAKKILNLKSWENNNDDLKNKYLKLENKKQKNEISKYMENKGGIKCYDSILDENKKYYKNYYCC